MTRHAKPTLRFGLATPAALVLAATALATTALPGVAAAQAAPAAPKASTPSAAPTATAASAGVVAAPTPAAAVTVKATNPLAAPRTSETVAVHLADLKKFAPTLEPAKIVVVDPLGKETLSQLVDMNGDDTPDDIVFQSDFASRETKAFTVQAGTRAMPSKEQYKVYGRFVRERHDDFAWENDRIAHRMYGPDLETWAKEPLTSSGIDVWTKRVRRLVVNEWYMTDDYHQDHGDGADMYSVGKSRGLGGLGIYKGNKLSVSHNFTASRVLANGPIRLVFELTYAPWDADGVKVTETKRIILDAGKNFDRVESTLRTDTKVTPLIVGIGIAKHAGSTSEADKRVGWMRTWEPLKEPNGNLGCALVVPGASVVDTKDTDTDYLLLARAPTDGPLTYYMGFGWDRSGDFADAAAWARAVESQAREVAAPIRTALSAGASVAPAKPAAPKTEAERMSESVMARAPSVLTEKWDYDTGLVLKGIERIGLARHDAADLAYVKRTIDGLVDESGSIKGYKADNYNIDQINMGKVLFRLFAEAQGKDKDRYRAAIELLRAQMKTHPRTDDGAFWHKKIYPHQMWLDGVYMASPFLAQYAATFKEPALLDDVTHQILLAEEHMRDAKTGLLHHGWDESKKERWADPKTGQSPEVWGRAMGWYAMAIVDVLEWVPADHPKRKAVIGVLQRLAAAIASVQDASTGVWWQVLDKGGRDKNYREASASSMFVYALSKAVKNGWIDKAVYGPVAMRGYRGVVAQFVEAGSDGRVDLKSVCKVAGLGGTPYRDGSYDYYTSTEVVKNDPKGVGAFLLAAVENE